MGMKQWMTFGIRTEGAKKAEKDIEGVGKAAKEASTETESLNANFEQGTDALDKMTGGAVSAFKGVVGGVKNAVKGMMTLKGAIISTGIGALVVAVATVVLYLTKTKRGAEQLEKATAVLGATMDVLFEALIPVGELIVKMFTDPQTAIAELEETLGPLGKFLNTLFTDPMQGVMDFGNMIKDYVLGAFKKIIEGAGLIGGALVKLFKGDFDGAWEDAKAGVVSLTDGVTDLIPITAQAKLMYKAVTYVIEEYGDEIMSAAEKTIALTAASQRLADAKRNLAVKVARAAEKLQELNRIAADSTRTFKDRIEAAEEAGEIEQGLADDRVAQAQAALGIQRAQNSMVSETSESLQALADLQIELANAETAAAGVTIANQEKINGLYTEQEEKIAANVLLEQERLNGMIERQDEIDAVIENAKTLEILAIQDKYRQMRLLAKLNGQILVGDKEAEGIELANIDAKFKQQELDRARAVWKAKTRMITDALGAVASLSSAFAKDDEESQRKAFERNKALGLVSAIINTASAVIGAIAPAAGGLGIPAGIPGALMAAASGAAQIATIQKTSFNSTAVEDDQALVEGDTGSFESQANAATSVDLSFLGQGSGSTLQAYVISEQVNTQLQADQIVTDQTTL